jgi:hypothetical protein
VNVLVACEESQRVTTEFRRLGHNAFSCDIIDQSGGHPEWHIMQDVLPLLNGDCVFETMDGQEHEVIGKWDMIIAFPPCTHLCSSGQRWFAEGKKPRSLQNEAIEFFMQFVNADCEKIAIENPVGIMSTRYRKPNQIINPYQFGSTECKKTCLWLKGLPNLVPTDVCPPEKRTTNIWKAKFNGKQYSWNSQETKKLRSKTFPGIAKAMAEQFGGDIRDVEVDGITTWR